MLWDCVCDKCGYKWDDWLDHHKICGECPKCGSHLTDTSPGGLKDEKAKDPYDYLDKRPPDNPIVVGPHLSKGRSK